MKTNTMLAMLTLGASALIVNAQDAGPPTPPPGGQHPLRPGGPGGPGSPGPNGHRPPPSPLMLALDTNHDGVIDAAEIAKAPAALKTLDKNGDGKLTQDELRPVRPPQNDSPKSTNDKTPGPRPGDS